MYFCNYVDIFISRLNILNFCRFFLIISYLLFLFDPCRKLPRLLFNFLFLLVTTIAILLFSWLLNLRSLPFSSPSTILDLDHFLNLLFFLWRVRKLSSSVFSSLLLISPLRPCIDFLLPRSHIKWFIFWLVMLFSLDAILNTRIFVGGQLRSLFCLIIASLSPPTPPKYLLIRNLHWFIGQLLHIRSLLILLNLLVSVKRINFCVGYENNSTFFNKTERVNNHWSYSSLISTFELNLFPVTFPQRKDFLYS